MFSVPARAGCARACAGAAAGGSSWTGCPFASAARNWTDGAKKSAASHRMREVQQTVVVAGRLADDHVLEHRLQRMERPGVADEIRARVADG